MLGARDYLRDRIGIHMAMRQEATLISKVDWIGCALTMLTVHGDAT